LLDKKPGTATMLFVRNIRVNEIGLGFEENLNTKIIFPKAHFNTIGIWWNNSGYPDEEGCRRNECAFEPVTGLSSNLSAEYKRGKYLLAAARKSYKWHIKWKMNHHRH
jgi:hypothetical protein